MNEPLTIGLGSTEAMCTGSHLDGLAVVGPRETEGFVHPSSRAIIEQREYHLGPIGVHALWMVARHPSHAVHTPQGVWPLGSPPLPHPTSG
jgi:hypothetical protein